MDLVAFIPGRPNALYDVVATNPVTAEVEVIETVNLTQTNKQAQIKKRRYAEKALAAGMTMRGLPIETYGKWGGDFTVMFNHFISLARRQLVSPPATSRASQLLASPDISVPPERSRQRNQYADQSPHRPARHSSPALTQGRGSLSILAG